MSEMQGLLACPRCPGRKLATAMTRQGVEVDHCPACGGVWLDKGEIFYCSSKHLIQELRRAQQAALPGALPSPANGAPMLRLKVFGVELDMCEETGGLWLDKGEVEQVAAAGDAAPRVTIDDSPTRSRIRRAADGGIPAAELAAYAAAARPLPNLAARSLTLMLVLYGLLTALLILAVELGALEAWMAVGIGLLVVAGQFLLGPFIMDISLRWFYSATWVAPHELPAHLHDFIARVCQEHGMRFPRVGIIHDGAPNAFTYGHTPGNARIVLTQGILDLLDEREVEAVVAHEIGHAVQWDMLLMTAAQLVPLVAYYVYRTLLRIRVRGRDRSAGARIAIAVGAYLVYVISEYLVLWLSRTREYRADNFAGRVIGNPNLLASALVKIGYGLAGQNRQQAREGEERGGQERERGRRPGLDAIGALGIFDGNAARAFAVSAVGGAGTTSLDPEHLKGAMRWDLWNPWARFYELHSTHPLIANRMEFLSRQAAAMRIPPMIVFDERQPESYWDEFLVDLLVMFLPALLPLAVAGLALAAGKPGLLWLAVSALGLGMLLKTLWSYRGDDFPGMNLAGLLRNVKVSAIRGVPCSIRGTVIGRGVPGLIWSEDFVIRDQTGIMFLDYRQPIRIWEFLFGLLRRAELQGAQVTATGWFRRAPTPYVELRTLTPAGGSTRTCYVYYVKLVVAVVLMLAGMFLTMRMR
jgi:Zn-dependent protease with chaperone function/Zn-finger nucleic acid-binding protein